MDIEHLALWIPAIISVLAAIYTAGVQAQTVKSHEKRLNGHSGTLEKHTEKLEAHAVKLTTLTAWHEGFTAGNHRG